ncbi:flagellin modification protein FlmC [Caulobacter sp. B11]|nr:flagellin modification protein FlmC [Caulobacter sp. B11]
MSSRRLPGKVLADLEGAPMILRQIERLRRAPSLGAIVVATSIEASDEPLAHCLAAAGVPVHRGALDDVLGRFADTLEHFGPAKTVVRLTADCPLADPEVIEATLALHRRTGADYASSTAAGRTFAKGLDVEVMTAASLLTAAAEATEAYDREHVTPFIYNHPQRFTVVGLTQPADEGDVRWTVDLPDDLEFVRAVYAALYPVKPAFTSDDVRDLVSRRPDLARLGGERRL